MLKYAAFGLALMLPGCGEQPGKTARPSMAARQAQAEAHLSKPPVPRIYSIQGNQLQVIDVPVKDGSGFVDQQRCFVWRDAEYKQATMSCGQQPEIIISNPN